MNKSMVFLFLFTVGIANSQELTKNNISSSNDVCNSENTAFQAGEKLTYKVFYNWGLLWVAAGEVEFEVKEIDDRFLYSAVGKSSSSYDLFFRVEDYFYSYVNKSDLLPIRAKRRTNEGGYKIFNDITFDQINKVAISSLKDNKKEMKTTEMKFDTCGCMHDVLSLIYSLRNIKKQNLNPNDHIKFNMMMDNDIYSLNMKYVSKTVEKEVKNLGVYRAYMVLPSLIKGRVFDDDAKMKIWISDDDNNIPLVIESPLAVGKVKAFLSGYENLKYPLAKIR